MSERPPASAKIVVAGGFGVGKTTLVSSVSEIVPLTTEAAMTSASLGVDDSSKVGRKMTTTVAMDFGRITIDKGLVLYVFGTPGQERFAFMWDDVVLGALGAVILVDTRRLEESYPAIDYFESRNIPFVIGINEFEDGHRYPADEIREALGVDVAIPIVSFDARSRDAAKQVLLTLLGMLRAQLLKRQQQQQMLAMQGRPQAQMAAQGQAPSGPAAPQPIQPMPIQPLAPQHRQPQHVQPQHVQPQHVQPQHVQPQQVAPEPLAGQPMSALFASTAHPAPGS